MKASAARSHSISPLRHRENETMHSHLNDRRGFGWPRMRRSMDIPGVEC